MRDGMALVVSVLLFPLPATATVPWYRAIDARFSQNHHHRESSRLVPGIDCTKEDAQRTAWSKL